MTAKKLATGTGVPPLTDPVLAGGPGSKDPGPLAVELGLLIVEARARVAQSVNSALTALYWQIGTRLRQDLQANGRAEYGAAMVAELGKRLSTQFGRGFDEKSLRHMLHFAGAFPDPSIVSALQHQLTWTHFKLLSYVDDALKREFYGEMCRVERWSTRLLQQKMDGMLYERTALSKRPDEVIRQELSAVWRRRPSIQSRARHGLRSFDEAHAAESALRLTYEARRARPNDSLRFPKRRCGKTRDAATADRRDTGPSPEGAIVPSVLSGKCSGLTQLRSTAAVTSLRSHDRCRHRPASSPARLARGGRVNTEELA